MSIFVLKFGFSRATAQASMMIRRKELSRNEALKQVKDVEGKFPETFLGKLEEILYEIDMSLNEFSQICDRFTNKKSFKLTKMEI